MKSGGENGIIEVVVKYLTKAVIILSNKTNVTTAKLLYSAMFLALALLLPFLTAQIPQIGSKLCPMHLPVILCGFICGPFWGAAVGITAPILRSVIFSVPVLVPNAIAMAAELAVYAFVAGTLFKKLNKNIFYIYVDLLAAMISGRLVWGAAEFILIFAGLAEGQIGFELIWAQTVLQSIPAIILQLVVIPLTVNVLKKNKLLLK